MISHIILDVCQLESSELVKSTIEFCNTERSNINSTNLKDISDETSLIREVVPGKNSLNPGEAASMTKPGEAGIGEASTSEAVPVISEVGTGEVVPRQSSFNQMIESDRDSSKKQPLVGGSSLLVEPEIIQTITPNIKSNPNVITSMKQLFNPTLVDMAFVNSNEYNKYIKCIPKLYEIGRDSLNILIKKYMIIYYDIRLLIEDMLNTTDDVTSEYFTYYLTDLNKLRKKQHTMLQYIEYDVLLNTKNDENKKILQLIRLLIQEIYIISNYEYHLYNKRGTWNDIDCNITDGDNFLALHLTSYTAQHPVQDYFDYLINDYVYYKKYQCVYFVNPTAFTDLLYDRLDDECKKLHSMGISDYYIQHIDPPNVSDGNLKSAESRLVTNVPLAVSTHSNSHIAIPADSRAVTNVPLAVPTHSNSHIAIPAESTPVIAEKDEFITKNPNTKSGDTRAFSINNLPENMPPARSTLNSMNEKSSSIETKIVTTLEKSKYADPTPESQEWHHALLKADNIQTTENIDLLNIIGILNNIIIHLNTKKELPDSLVTLLLDLVITADSEMLKELSDMIFSLVFKPHTDTSVFNKSIQEIIDDLRTDVNVDATMKQHIETYVIEKLNFPTSKYNATIQAFRNISIGSDLTLIKDAIILAIQ